MLHYQPLFNLLSPHFAGVNAQMLWIHLLFYGLFLFEEEKHNTSNYGTINCCIVIYHFHLDYVYRESHLHLQRSERCKQMPQMVWEWCGNALQLSQLPLSTITMMNSQINWHGHPNDMIIIIIVSSKWKYTKNTENLLARISKFSNSMAVAGYFWNRKWYDFLITSLPTQFLQCTRFIGYYL